LSFDTSPGELELFDTHARKIRNPGDFREFRPNRRVGVGCEA
jgi:hypothetical protein